MNEVVACYTLHATHYNPTVACYALQSHSGLLHATHYNPTVACYMLRTTIAHYTTHPAITYLVQLTCSITTCYMTKHFQKGSLMYNVHIHISTHYTTHPAITYLVQLTCSITTCYMTKHFQKCSHMYNVHIHISLK